MGKLTREQIDERNMKISYTNYLKRLNKLKNANVISSKTKAIEFDVYSDIYEMNKSNSKRYGKSVSRYIADNTTSTSNLSYQQGELYYKQAMEFAKGNKNIKNPFLGKGNEFKWMYLQPIYDHRGNMVGEEWMEATLSTLDTRPGARTGARISKEEIINKLSTLPGRARFYFLTTFLGLSNKEASDFFETMY